VVWTADELLADMKRKSNLPTGTNAKFSDPQMLKIAYEVLLSRVDPILTNLREEYGIMREDFAVTSADGTYKLPERAVSGTIRQVLVVMPNGRPYPIERLAEANAWQYEGTGVTASEPSFFALEDDTLRLLPVPSTSGLTLRIAYRRRPSVLVKVNTCAIVTVVGATTLTTTGGTWAASQVVDVVRAKPPFGIPVQAATATQAAGVFTFAAGLLGKVSVGDYVCLQDTTCVVPVPERFNVLLTHLASAELLEEWGDGDGAATIRDAVDEYVSGLVAAQSNRVEASPQLVIQGGSSLRGAFGRRRY